MLPVLLALYTPTAQAFAPTDETWIGIEPVRVQRTNPAEQGRFRRMPAWQQFTAGEGAGWFARFDEVTGTARRAFGPGIPLGEARTQEEVQRATLAFFERNAGLIGVDPAELRPRSAGYVAHLDTWYLDFDRVVPGADVPIWRGGVTARVRGGDLILFGVHTWPAVTTLAGAQVSEARALELATLTGPVALADHQDLSAKLVALPVGGWIAGPTTGDQAAELRLVWEVHSRTDAPLGRWVTMIDATTGEHLTTWNEIRFFSGTVMGEHDTRTVDGNMSTSPLPLMRFDGSDGSTSYADENGAFTLSDEVSWSANLRGSYVTVRNEGRGGEDGEMSISGSSPTWDTGSATQAEIDSYKFLHDVRTWGLAIAPDVGMATDRLTSNVNINSSCNAYYDGDVNFYTAGGGCNNTGQIADVNYHEWGHGWHYYAIESGSFDGSVSEGAGDFVSNLLTASSEIGPYFFTNGSPIRDTADDLVYPDDLNHDTHNNGLIWAGSMWDLWELLAADYGETREDRGEAWTITSTLFTDALRGGPDLAETYDEVLAADDDDGDVTNGTPHVCHIVEAFNRHGLGPGGTEQLITLDHAPIGNQPADADIPVSGAVLNLSPECSEFSLSTATIHYTTDGGGSWQDVTMSASGDAVSAVIPGLPDGTIVHYWLEAVGADGTTVELPVGGEIAPYSFYVGGLTQVYCNSFDTDDGDFEHELLDGDNDEGADDWQWDRPSGESEDPASAYSAPRVWGNDLGDGNYNGAYQDDIRSRLTTPAYDLSGADAVVVQFQRWLNVEDGYRDHARVFINDTEVWANFDSGSARIGAHTQDGQWKLHTVRLDGVGGSANVAWELETSGSGSYGGWTIDDFCVYVPIDFNTLYAVTDFSASDNEVGEVDVAWTQPGDAGATHAVVVRRADRFAESRTDIGDGSVVFDADVTPGAPMTFSDAVEGTWYYTVFAGSGDGWLSGAVDPGNADDGTGLTAGEENGGNGESGGETSDFGENPEEGETLKINTGCGCTTSSHAGPRALGLGALLGALVLRRRARR